MTMVCRSFRLDCVRARTAVWVVHLYECVRIGWPDKPIELLVVLHVLQLCYYTGRFRSKPPIELPRSSSTRVGSTARLMTRRSKLRSAGIGGS